MIALLIKDWRLNLPATIAWIIVFVVMPVAMILSVVSERRYAISWSSSELSDAALSGIVASLVISSIIIPAFGATAFARERRDRSADFLSSFSIPRARVVASKVLTTLLLCVLPWIGAAVLTVLASIIWPLHIRWEVENFRHGASDVIRTVACVQLMLLGVSWMLSSILRSEFSAGASTVLFGLISLAMWGVVASRMSERGPEAGQLAYQIGVVSAIAIGISGLIAGTIIALRRISP